MNDFFFNKEFMLQLLHNKHSSYNWRNINTIYLHLIQMIANLVYRILYSIAKKHMHKHMQMHNVLIAFNVWSISIEP